MEKHERKFIGIIGARENTENYLSQMDIPEDAFILDTNEALENVPVMEWLKKRSREVAPRERDADALFGMLEFAELDQEKDCMTGQLQGGRCGGCYCSKPCCLTNTIWSYLVCLMD